MLYEHRKEQEKLDSRIKTLLLCEKYKDSIIIDEMDGPSNGGRIASGGSRKIILNKEEMTKDFDKSLEDDKFGIFFRYFTAISSTLVLISMLICIWV
jgi:hypothetical protein